MSAAVCPSLQVDVSGVGERHEEINTIVNADGSYKVIINDLVTGTASDSTGTYKFVYQNHSVEIAPAGGGAHQVSMEDSFEMHGNGSADNIHVGFNLRWTYTPPEPLWPPVHDVQQVSMHGNPLQCDPI
jgi:hypothetical protein